MDKKRIVLLIIVVALIVCAAWPKVIGYLWSIVYAP